MNWPLSRALYTALLPTEKREARRKSLITFRTDIAAASGGILGFGSKIFEAEQAVIERIAAELEYGHRDTAKQLIECY
jgi:hypothetical protein